jgi:hypothetical protein
VTGLMSRLLKGCKSRPLFRYLAAAIAIFCLILAGVFGWVQMDGRLVGVVICLIVGFVMATIAVTGYWPPKR